MTTPSAIAASHEVAVTDVFADGVNVRDIRDWGHGVFVPRGKWRGIRAVEIIWQAVESDPSWGYWYMTRRQAERQSNASDRMIAHDCR